MVSSEEDSLGKFKVVPSVTAAAAAVAAAGGRRRRKEFKGSRVDLWFMVY